MAFKKWFCCCCFFQQNWKPMRRCPGLQKLIHGMKKGLLLIHTPLRLPPPTTSLSSGLRIECITSYTLGKYTNIKQCPLPSFSAQSHFRLGLSCAYKGANSCPCSKQKERSRAIYKLSSQSKSKSTSDKKFKQPFSPK